MSQFVDTPTKTYPVATAIGKYIRVKLNGSGKLAVAGLTDRAIGVTCDETFAADENVTVALMSKQGTMKMTAGAAITEGAVVYGLASGKIDDADGGSAVIHGVALEAAAADGDIIEVLPALQ